MIEIQWWYYPAIIHAGGAATVFHLSWNRWFNSDSYEKRSLENLVEPIGGTKFIIGLMVVTSLLGWPVLLARDAYLRARHAWRQRRTGTCPNPERCRYCRKKPVARWPQEDRR